MSDSGSTFLVPEKTRSQLGVRSSAQRRTIATALLQSGTTCSRLAFIRCLGIVQRRRPRSNRSEEHTSELQSLMRISYAVFCLKKKTYIIHKSHYDSKQTYHHSPLSQYSIKLI